MPEHQAPILFYDGECGLCARSVRFILDHEHSPILKFGALQSDTAQRLLSPHGIDTSALSSLVLLEHDKAYTHSTAALKTCPYLKAPWRWGRLALVLPRCLRDPLYNFIARHRLRLFGKNECAIPTLEERARFIDH